MRFLKLQVLFVFFLVVSWSGNLLAGNNPGVLFKEYLAMSNDYKARVGNSYLLKYFSRDAVLIYSDNPIINEIRESHPEVFRPINIPEFLNSGYPFIAVKANQLTSIKQHNVEIGNGISCLSILGTNKKEESVILALQYIREDFSWKILKTFTGFVPETFKGYLEAPCSAFNER